MNFGMLALTLPLFGAGPIELGPPPIPAPLTYVKVHGPAGARVTWYPGTAQKINDFNDSVAALRPGYIYRFELSELGDTRTQTIWPSIEVRGSLVPRSNMKVADHPIPIHFSDDEIERILAGRFVSKVYFLEDPDLAVNVAHTPGVPQEISTSDEAEALKEARKRGRLMIIVRAGERLWTPEELAVENVPGTIFVPSKMRTIPTPVAAPRFGFINIPFDPILGPKALTGECLYDGGDRNYNLGIGRENKIYGLDPSDTSMEFTTPWGKRVVTSNRVCICIPRFAAMRVELGATVQHAFRGPELRHQIDGQRAVIHKTPPIRIDQFEQPINQAAWLKPSRLIHETTPHIKTTLFDRPAAVANWKGTQIAAQLFEAEDITIYPDCRLTLTKRMDPPNPKQIGETVTFYLSYRNPTLAPMTEVIISDSLNARLEYVDGSAKSDQAATFTATPNEAGSVTLRWAIDGKLLPGQSGVVAFRAKIR